MKAITLHQPFASLIGFGFKEYETRDWQPAPNQLRPGGWLAICAAGYGSTKAADLDATLDQPVMKATLGALGINRGNRTHVNLPLGVVVCMAQVEGFYRAEGVNPSLLERELGDWSAGRKVWRLQRVMLLQRPVRCRGKQGLWTLPPDVAIKVVAQLIADGTIQPAVGGRLLLDGAALGATMEPKDVTPKKGRKKRVGKPEDEAQRQRRGGGLPAALAATMAVADVLMVDQPKGKH